MYFETVGLHFKGLEVCFADRCNLKIFKRIVKYFLPVFNLCISYAVFKKKKDPSVETERPLTIACHMKKN